MYQSVASVAVTVLMIAVLSLFALLLRADTREGHAS